MWALELNNISKAYGSCISCDSVSLQIKKGEVHALLGENGAGKSTLMKIIFGLIHPDQGEIKVNGTTVAMTSSKVAIDHGIGMVHQHFMLIKPFTVLQNIILGIESKNFIGMIDYHKAHSEVDLISKQFNFNLNLDQKVEELTVGMQQRVEILKTLCRKAEILIFDEPTAVLTPQEIAEFEKIVAALKNEGKTILVITHKLHEIKAMADRCSIIRKGKFIETVEVATTSESDLAAKMVGRTVNLSSFRQPLAPIASREIVLKLENLTLKNNKGLLALNNFSLTLRKGEILGLAGIDGNGQSELVEALNGVRDTTDGKIVMNGVDLAHRSPKEIYDHKLSIIPADRQLSGLVLDYEVRENFVLQTVSDPPFSSNGFINTRAIADFAAEMVKRFDIRTPSLETPASSLSGGNQQKIILAREIANNPDVLIAFQPTRGLDVGAIEFIHNELIKLRDSGKAVLLISYELDEILNLSDRLSIIYEGSITAEYSPDDLSQKSKHLLKQEIGLAMAGSR